MDITLGEFFNMQSDWSAKTFGPADVRGPRGPLIHLGKEVAESLETLNYGGINDEFLEELADCLFLLVDAAWRAGYTNKDLMGMAYQKLEKNRARTWPDWRTADANAPVEHVRS